MNKIIQSATWSFFVVSILNGLLVIAKESYHPLKTLMINLTGHHWLTHGVVIIVSYILLTVVLSGIFEKAYVKDALLSARLIQGVICGVTLIVGFYLIH